MILLWITKAENLPFSVGHLVNTVVSRAPVWSERCPEFYSRRR